MKDGYIEDYISGQEVKATPEEIEAIQVFSKQLVEDYNYPKDHIQTRPQFRVKVRPSDTKKEYPVDIAVFPNNKKQEDDVFIIVECKKKNRKDGKTQLQDYLRFSKAYLGVWFNGEERLFLRKLEKTGRIEFEEIPNIPQYKQRVEDIGKFKRKDLKSTHNLKATFKAIRNHLAANTVGATRDEVLAQQLINLIFCKIYDERFTEPNEIVSFRAGIDEKPKDVKERILDLFTKVKRKYKEVLDTSDVINLDDKSITYVVGELQNYCLVEAERDVISDAFEVFIGHALKGGQGQFFTPRNVVKMMVEILNPNDEDLLIDPACGSGGFLIEALRHVWRKLDTEGEKYHWNKSNLQEEKMEVALNRIRGIDKDYFLSKVAKAYMAIIGDGKSGIVCEDSLENPQNWNEKTRIKIDLNKFSVLLTNPPFGSKIPVRGEEKLKQYDLGHKWKQDKKTEEWEKGKLKDKEAPQILFIERCLELLKDGGRLGIILPESMFCNPSHRYIVKYIKSVARIKAVVSLPEELFQPHTHAKTCTVVIEKIPTDQEDGHEIFMGIAKWCGHDSRGLPIPHDDLPSILSKYMEYKKQGSLNYDHLGFVINELDIKDNIYLPKYYNPEIRKKLEELKKTHDLISFVELVRDGTLSISTGHEVGKLAYGTGKIPFIRTSEIANWEIKLDPKHGLSEEIYEDLKDRQDVQENDILMVRDGTYLVGICALVTRLDTKIIYQSHIYKIRSNDHKKIHPYLLLAVLTSPIVKEQIFAKRFTQDIIDTLGSRIHELVLPIPKDGKTRKEIIKNVKTVLEHKNAARELTRKTILEVAPVGDSLVDNEFFTMIK